MSLTTKTTIHELTYLINGAAIEVHKKLGATVLESVYHKCMMYELELRNIPFISECIVPINYKGLELDAKLRCDLFVWDSIVVELKAVKKVLPIHEAQLMTYMKLLKAPKGVLINFHVQNIIREGHFAYVNEYFKKLPEE